MQSVFWTIWNGTLGEPKLIMFTDQGCASTVRISFCTNGSVLKQSATCSGVATFRTAIPRMTPLSPNGPAANNLDFSNKAPKLPTCSLCILPSSSRLIPFVFSREGPVCRKTQVIGSAVTLFVLPASVRKARASRRGMMKFLMCLERVWELREPVAADVRRRTSRQIRAHSPPPHVGGYHF